MEILPSRGEQISAETQSGQHLELPTEHDVIPLPVAGICISTYCNALPKIFNDSFYYIDYDSKAVLVPFKRPPLLDAPAEVVVRIIREYEELAPKLLKAGRRVVRWGRMPVIGRFIRQSAHEKLLAVLKNIVALPSARTSMQEHVDALFRVREAMLYVAVSLIRARGLEIRAPTIPDILVCGPGRTFVTACKVGVMRFGNLQRLLGGFGVHLVPALIVVLPDKGTINDFRNSGNEEVLVEILRELFDVMGMPGFVRFLMAPKGLLLKSQVRGQGAQVGGAQWCNQWCNGLVDNARLEANLNDYMRYQADFINLLTAYLSGGENFARELVAESTQDTVILVGGPVNLTQRKAEVSAAPALLRYLTVDPARCGMLGVVNSHALARLLGYSEALFLKIRRDVVKSSLFSVAKVTVNEAIDAYCRYLQEIQEHGLYREVCGP